jgi:hypothetical protein
MIKRKIKEIQSLMTNDTSKEELEKKSILRKNKKKLHLASMSTLWPDCETKITSHIKNCIKQRRSTLK